MAYAVRHYASLEIVDLVFSGIVTGADLRAATTEFIALQRKTGVMRVLISATEMDANVAPAEIDDLLERQYLVEERDRRTRTAVIAPKTAKAREAAAYFERACTKRGWHCRVFNDRKSAMDWLTSTAPIGAR